MISIGSLDVAIRNAKKQWKRLECELSEGTIQWRPARAVPATAVYVLVEELKGIWECRNDYHCKRRSWVYRIEFYTIF